MLFRLAAVAAVVLLSSASAFADTGDAKLQLFKDIQKQVNRYAYFTIFDDVEIGIEDDGVVFLTGNVTNTFKKGDIAKRVAKVDGVTHINNAIDVLPVSRFDNEVRYRVARAIYSRGGFQHYSRHNPPVHIVVENRHVTLTGVVDSEVDRVLAESLAWQFGTRTVTNELRTTGEAKAELELLN